MMTNIETGIASLTVVFFLPFLVENICERLKGMNHILKSLHFQPDRQELIVPLGERLENVS